MNRALIIGGTAAAVTAAGGVAYYFYRRSQAQALGPGSEPAPPSLDSPTPQTPEPAPAPAPTPQLPPAGTPEAERVGVWDNVLPLPTAADVSGDLESNWGSTPPTYRPLFQLMEEASGIEGSARIYSVIAYGESRYVPAAQNGDGDSSRDKAERTYSNRAWNTMQGFGYNAENVPYGPEAANFGSGGLLGALAPYFLAIGAVSLGKANAPLVKSPPQIIFLPRVAAFHGVVFLWRLHKQYDVKDIPDIKVGWGSPSLLSAKNRGGTTYTKIHEKFVRHAGEVGIDLSKLPSKLNVDAFPGVMPVFEKIVGTLPTRAG